jgi:hypothetical protein
VRPAVELRDGVDLGPNVIQSTLWYIAHIIAAPHPTPASLACRTARPRPRQSHAAAQLASGGSGARNAAAAAAARSETSAAASGSLASSSLDGSSLSGALQAIPASICGWLRFVSDGHAG